MAEALLISLRPANLHWLLEEQGEEADLCAHSPVEFIIGGETIVRPEAGDWTVSASAVYLLRTLTGSHTKVDPVCEHLFPCCGHLMYAEDGSEDVSILGCFSGIDLEILHEGGAIIIRDGDSRSFAVSVATWRDAVCSFADEVRFFYARSTPRQPFDDESGRGFRRMLEEWDRRREQAMRLALSE